MRATIVVVPRERFSYSQRSLESLLEHTTEPYRLVYVDGGSPAGIRDYLRSKAKEHGFKLIRTEFFLSPNEARNLALAELDTEFVVFADNDVTFEPQWLEKLLACADETGAWIVGPLNLIGPPGTDVIHMAGGDMGFREEEGRKVFFEDHRLLNKSLAEHGDTLRREKVDLVEYHTMLVRREAIEVFGPLDEALLSANDHIDLCLQAHRHGGAVVFEPAVKITHTPTFPEGPGDRAYHLLRWSAAWNALTLDHFASKWDIDRDGKCLADQERWLKRHRRSIYRRFRSFDPVVSPLLTRVALMKRAAGLPLRA